VERVGPVLVSALTEAQAESVELDEVLQVTELGIIQDAGGRSVFDRVNFIIEYPEIDATRAKRVLSKITARLIFSASESLIYLHITVLILITIIGYMQVMAISECWSIMNVGMHSSVSSKVSESYRGAVNIRPRIEKSLGIAVVAVYFATPVSARLAAKYISRCRFHDRQSCAFTISL
jgi:hypothetical protein